VREWTTLDLIGSYTFNLPPPAPAQVRDSVHSQKRREIADVEFWPGLVAAAEMPRITDVGIND
jgi:hypothetical protein